MKTRLIALMTVLACATLAHAADLSGAWNVTKMTSDGQPVPEEVCKSLQMTFSGTSYQLVQNGVALESGAFKLDEKTIDLTAAGAPVQQGLYQLTGDALTIAKGAARPADLEGKPGVTRLELTRVPPPK